MVYGGVFIKNYVMYHNAGDGMLAASITNSKPQNTKYQASTKLFYLTMPRVEPGTSFPKGVELYLSASLGNIDFKLETPSIISATQ
jgi:hypothetical protein